MADGDFLLKLVERGGADVGRQQYLSWRNTGLAYRLEKSRCGQTAIPVLEVHRAWLAYRLEKNKRR